MIKTIDTKGKVNYYKLKKFIKLLNKEELNLSSLKIEIVKPLHELKSVTR